MNKIKKLINELCPDGVEYKTIGDVCDIGSVGIDKIIKSNERMVSLLNYVDVYNNKYLTQNDITATSSVKEENYENFTALKNDIFFTPSSETKEDIGHTSMIIEDIHNCCYSYHIIRLRIKKDVELNSKFLNYLFDVESIRKQIEMYANGATRFVINVGDLKKIQIPVPPIEIQEKIVEILDKFSSLIASLKTELPLRKKQYEYYRNKLLDFSDGSRVVEWKTIGDVCEIGTGGEPPSDYSTQRDDVYKFPIFSNGLSDRSIWGYSKTYSDIAPKITLSSIGTIGCPEIRYENFTPIIRLKTLYPKDSSVLNIYYLKYIIEIHKYQCNEGNVKNINSDYVKKIQIPIPSLEEQERIVGILDKLNTLTNNLTNGIPAEIKMRQQQYEYYRNMLLSF